MMLIDSVIGNINRDKALKVTRDRMLGQGLVETIKIRRFESARIRMRKISSRETDIMISLPVGTILKHGDVVALTEDKIVIVELEPETVAVLELKDGAESKKIVELSVKVGHAIGNLHRPLKVVGRRIYFPLQTTEELEMFKKLFAPITEYVDIKTVYEVFEPQDDVKPHEH